ncbi:hypothetical protein Tco_1317509 [Tanacetum coccineum]
MYLFWETPKVLCKLGTTFLKLSEYINTPAWNRPLGLLILTLFRQRNSDEYISLVSRNLVPTPIEFEDFSDDECDLPPYDDSSKNHDFTFSNPLFDIDEDFTLSDESFSEEDIPKENFIIFSNPLFDLDEEIASTSRSINDEVLEGIHSIPRIDSFDADLIL